jgi:hypothetical protein
MAVAGIGFLKFLFEECFPNVISAQAGTGREQEKKTQGCSAHDDFPAGVSVVSGTLNIGVVSVARPRA